jgi:hypothetical protein
MSEGSNVLTDGGFMSFPYIVYTPPYSAEVGGIKVLHRLVHELNVKGYEAFATGTTNPEWWEPTTNSVPDTGIAVYPEVVAGNPWGTNTVARWVLNVPGRLGGEEEYAKTELIFPFKRVYNQWGLPEDRILLLPVIEMDLFYDMGLKRSGRAFYNGKGINCPRVPETEGLMEIVKEDNWDKEALALKLNSIELLYTYDNITALWDVARMCGCPVVIIPNGEMTREHFDMDEAGTDGLGLGIEETQKALDTIDSVSFKEHYSTLFNTFDSRLDTFISITQARAGYSNSLPLGRKNEGISHRG